MQSYINAVVHVRKVDRERQTDTLNYDISTVCGRKPRTTPQKASRLIMGSEQVTRPKDLRAI